VRKSDRYLDAHIESDAQRSGYNVHQARSKSETGARVDQFGVAFAHDFIKTSRGTYSGMLVGGNPFLENPTKVTIDAVLIPLIVQIIQPNGSVVTFDPTAPDTNCDGGFSVEHRFKNSPLVAPSNLTFNGVSVGKVQYIDGFMRAAFWDVPAPGFPNRTSYFNPLKWSFAPAFAFPPVPASVGVVNGTGCDQTGVVAKSFFNSTLKLFLPVLQAGGVISPTKFALFLTKNVSAASTISPTPSGFLGGEHFATGSPVQTWAWAQYKHTTKASTDVEVASHEIGEWMNDPLVNNPTPSWGHEGEVSNCSAVLEVGDPLNKTPVPITLNGYKFHVQELAFFSWFYNPDGFFSYGAGGKFSSNGTFSGPSKPCPPGGTY
jgi:hypothetical protein